MQFSTQTPDGFQCRICRTALKAGAAFCPSCGAQVDEMPVEEWRGIAYLLSEVKRWEAVGFISSEQAATLRQRYERRREQLRAQIESNGESAKASAPPSSEAHTPEPDVQTANTTPHTDTSEAASPDYSVAAAFSEFLSTPPQPQPPPGREPASQRPRRTLIETLTEPYTLRLLLYTGAAMLIVGIVIWLRDVLYLKLQEPVVQAGLLAFGTLAVTASGWYTILRTRQRLTGRALTLIGSVLVPVNFWFLVRSGLVSDKGRAWLVCVLCALLYALTATLLRERLYVYLSSIASIAAAWSLVFRFEREAFGLYALALMGASLVFLHLSRLFPPEENADEEKVKSTGEDEDASNRNGTIKGARFTYELWGPPLVHMSLAGATLCALLYMPLRLWPSISLYDGIFRWRASTYDSSIAMLLFAALGYILWFTGRYIYTNRRLLLYTLSTLALFWTGFLALDGFRLSASTNLLILAATTLCISIAARLMRDDEVSTALHSAGTLLSVTLALSAFTVLLAASVYTVKHSAALACLAVSFALLSAPRFCERLAQTVLAHASALFASLAFLLALMSASLQSETLNVVACAAWPFVLYAFAQFARRRPNEAQLAAPFVRIADAHFVILFLWASTVALILHSLESQSVAASRPAMFCALSAAILYGALRGARERSGFGAVLASLAALVMVAASLDTLRVLGLWPGAWPVAAGVVVAAFLMRKAAANWPQPESETDSGGLRSLNVWIAFVMDSAVIVCALLWFARAAFEMYDGGFGASFVLLLALLYWIERAARSRLSGHVYLATTQAGAFFIALLIALRVDAQWFPALAVLILFPVFFALGRAARVREAVWLASPANTAAHLTVALAFIVAMLQAMPNLQAGNPSLLAPCISVGAVALATFCASLLSAGEWRVHYFRAGLSATVISFVLACLRAGFDPVSDIEIYTSPVAVLLLGVAYMSARRERAEYGDDTSLLLWLGSLLLCGPLLLHALHFRLLLDVPAPARDIGTLGASLALILFGVIGRLRAPVIVGAITLAVELAALALTSVDWLQVPLKYYLITVGVLMLFVFWLFEYRSEHILLARKRFNERREYARERFGEWK